MKSHQINSKKLLRLTTVGSIFPNIGPKIDKFFSDIDVDASKTNGTFWSFGVGLKSCLKDFVLEEDNDSGHGPSSKNPVRESKEKYGLKAFFNCPKSPNLSPIENAWIASKMEVRKYPHFDINALKTLAVEGWDKLSQETINHWIDSMPKMLLQES